MYSCFTVEHYLQTYTEPLAPNTFNMTASTSTSSISPAPTTSFPATTTLVTTTTAADQVTLPLTQGSLTNNLGIPITVVCCKVGVDVIYTIHCLTYYC